MSAVVIYRREAEPRVRALAAKMGWEFNRALGCVISLWGDSQALKRIEGDQQDILFWAREDKIKNGHLFFSILQDPSVGIIKPGSAPGLWRICGNGDEIEKIAHVSKVRSEAAKKRWADSSANDDAIAEPDAMQDEMHVLCPSLAKPSLAKPIKYNKPLSKNSADKNWDAAHPWAKVFEHLNAWPKYGAIFDREKDTAVLEAHAERYKLSAADLEEVAYQLRIWADGPSSDKVKSPRGTLATFVRSYVQRRPKAKQSDIPTYTEADLDKLL